MFDRPELNNEHYDDCYFSYLEGFEEALYVYVAGNGLPERIGIEPFCVGETGFGTGLNLIALIIALEQAQKKNWKISFYSVEKYPLTPQRISELFEPFMAEMEAIARPFLAQWEKLYLTLIEGWNQVSFDFGSGRINLSLYIGDILDFMENITTPMDAWFLDGHSPDKNPDMWVDAVFAGLGKHSKPRSTVSTFTSAGFVKRGLRAEGFTISRIKGFGGKRHMLVGVRE